MSYLGSKAQAGVFHTIIGNMPPHSMYGEPFLGTGKVMFTKCAADINVGIDADAGLIAKHDADRGNEQFKFICGDALMLVPQMTLPADALLYFDPPYLRETRTSRHSYRHEFDTAQHHEALLTMLQGLNCFVMLSGYPSKLYAERLRDWRCVSYRTRTRGRTVTECLWCNFPEPVELHDWRFAGKNFRERLTLRRRVTRLQGKLDRLSPRHRGYVLDSIQQRYFRRLGPATIAGKDAAR